MKFEGRGNMVATFVVEKKRLVNGNLRELASEAVARCLRDEEELLELEVPRTRLWTTVRRRKDKTMISTRLRTRVRRRRRRCTAPARTEPLPGGAPPGRPVF